MRRADFAQLLIRATKWRADALRHRGVEQVRPDCRYRVNAEQQDQERRDQRSAADPGHTDKRADADPVQA